MYSVMTPLRRYVTPWRYLHDATNASTRVIDNFRLMVEYNGDSYSWTVRDTRDNGLVAHGHDDLMYKAQDAAESYANAN